MSNTVLPSLVGLGIEVTRTPIFDTIVQQATSGKETRIAKQVSPRYQYDLMYNVLRSGSQLEYQTLLGFFNSLNGQFDTFLYTDPDDNSVTGQAIGTGDASTKVFQLIRTLGAFLEPVLAPNIFSNLYLNGTAIPSTGLTAPGSPSLSSVASGSLGGATYFVRTAYITASGETAASSEVSLAVSASHVVRVASPAAQTGATGYNVYVSTVTNTETRQNVSPIAIGTAWQEPNTGLISGTALPAGNTTGWSLAFWGSASGPGVITFTGIPANGVAISADFTYYWACRMIMDQMALKQMYSRKYKVGKFSFMTVKN